jgi:hypothetical protein
MDAKDVANIKGKWFCNECRAKRVSRIISWTFTSHFDINISQQRPSKPNSKVLLGNLAYKLETSNPVLFELPKEIKQLFQGGELYLMTVIGSHVTHSLIPLNSIFK